MTDLTMTQRKVTIIPALPKELAQARMRKLRVAAYCRVSTEEEEQQSSYEIQCSYYTEKILSHPEWELVDIFADEGITGTSTKKRDDFNRMIRMCRKGKIDLILTKSVPRFARNTLDTLNYTRMLKAMGIGVSFERENINTLEMDNEMLITFFAAFAQAESESTSKNVAWGKRKAIRQGKVSYHYKTFYGYRKGPDGLPERVEEQSKVYIGMCAQFLSGYSLRNIEDDLKARNIPYMDGKEWNIKTIRSLLMSEKYCGDVLLQKTFIEDCISKKVVKNTGQLDQVLVENCHPATISRDMHNAILAEFARRNAGKSPTKQASTGQSCYSSKYALSERLVCGECGTLYRRCVWKRNGTEKIVWRCVNRLDNGTRFCHDSPSIEEGALQSAILAALNSIMSSKQTLVGYITDAMETELVQHPDSQQSMGEINDRIEELEKEFSILFDETSECDCPVETADRFLAITQELAELKKQRKVVERQQVQERKSYDQVKVAQELMVEMNPSITQWDEITIRQLVHTVKVISAELIEVYLNDGKVIHQRVENKVRKRRP